ncbi:hypothetical protein ACNOYE_21680 [Nannocystaceae bacterium ST9]
MLRARVSSLLPLALLACGDPSGRDDQASGVEGIASNDEVEVGQDTSEAGTAEGNTDDADGNTTASSSDDADGEGGNQKWDVLSIPDSANNCEGMTDETHSYIWIANSSQSSVSKINTQTLVEEARYFTRGDQAGNPSRTSVALSGNVAVANRSGGVVKFYANIEDCQDTNGTPGIQTSSGPNDLLPFGQDECMAWYTPFGYSTQRPLAWAQGNFNEGSCKYEDEKLWTAGNMGNAEVVLMDGETGAVEQTVVIPNVIGWAGLYGGAVDGDGNFWTVDHNWSGPSTLIRVDRQSFTYQAWPVTGQVHYGLAVDSKGRAWLCGSGGASRFDPDTESWTHLAPIGDGSSALGGCMEDAEGVLWTSPYPNPQLVGIDTETVQIVQTIQIPAYVHGVSIDFEGHIWGVEFAGSNAYRVDPETLQVDTVGGLIGAYTYSDMTGFAISSAGTPSG